MTDSETDTGVEIGTVETVEFRHVSFAYKENIPIQIWSALQKQNHADIVYNNIRYTSDMVLGPPRKGLSVTFCTDTRPVPALVPFAKDSDLFIRRSEICR